MKKSLALALAALVVAPALHAAEPEAQQAQSQTPPQEEKKICRTNRATGSLTRVNRICLTAAQWREVNSRTYRGVSEMQGEAGGGTAVANNRGAGG